MAQTLRPHQAGNHPHHQICLRGRRGEEVNWCRIPSCAPTQETHVEVPAEEGIGGHVISTRKLQDRLQGLFEKLKRFEFLCFFF